TQNHHADTNKHEREESADVRQTHHLIDSRNRSDATNGNTGQNRRDVWRLETRMHTREHRWQQSIASHREEDARLSELEHEKHSRVRYYRSKSDDCVLPQRLRRNAFESHGERFASLRRGPTHNRPPRHHSREHG